VGGHDDLDVLARLGQRVGEDTGCGRVQGGLGVLDRGQPGPPVERSGLKQGREDRGCADRPVRGRVRAELGPLVIRVPGGAERYGNVPACGAWAYGLDAGGDGMQVAVDAFPDVGPGGIPGIADGSTGPPGPRSASGASSPAYTTRYWPAESWPSLNVTSTSPPRTIRTSRLTRTTRPEIAWGTMRRSRSGLTCAAWPKIARTMLTSPIHKGVRSIPPSHRIRADPAGTPGY
jgi:hypothetical protein